MTTIRFPVARNPDGLSLEQVRQAAPAAFATRASPRCSERYAFLSTADLIRPLLDKGWIVTGAVQRATRLEGRNPKFTRHQLNLAPKDAKSFLKRVGDVRPELTIINSHDRQSTFCLWGGLCRLACLNGLVVSALEFDTYFRRHVGPSGEILEQADAALKVVTESGKMVELMSRVKLNEKAANRFAQKAAKLAYDEANFDTSILTQARREADAGDSVWHIYNRVQENLIRGGLHIQRRGHERSSMLRGISHIQRSVDLNLGLWNLAVETAKAA